MNSEELAATYGKEHITVATPGKWVWLTIVTGSVGLSDDGHEAVPVVSITDSHLQQVIWTQAYEGLVIHLIGQSQNNNYNVAPPTELN